MISGRPALSAKALVPFAALAVIASTQAASAQDRETVQATLKLLPVELDLAQIGAPATNPTAPFTIAAIAGEVRGTLSGGSEWPGARTELVGVAVYGKGYLGEHELTASLGSFETVRLADPRFAGALALKAPLAAFGQFTRPGYSLRLIDADTAPLRQPGFFASLALGLPGSFRLEATHSDTLGDPELALIASQGSWQSRSDTISLVTDLPRGWQFRAAGFQGRTLASDNMGGSAWIDTSYRAGSASLSRKLGANLISARFDAFAARNRGSLVDARDNEDGWAMSLNASRKLGPLAIARAEYVHLQSRRALMPASSETTTRSQDKVQLSMQVKW